MDYIGSKLAIGTAVLIVYFFYYIFFALSLFGSRVKTEDLLSRAGKFHLFGIIGVFGLIYGTPFSGVLSWLTGFVLIVMLVGTWLTNDESQKRLFYIGDIIFLFGLSTWYIGAMATFLTEFKGVQ